MLWKSVEILSSRGRKKHATDRGALLKSQHTKSDSQPFTMGSGKRKTELPISWGKVGVCGYGERAEGTATRIPVLSHSPTVQTLSFLGGVFPLIDSLTGFLSIPYCGTCTLLRVSCLGWEVEILTDSRGISDWVVWLWAEAIFLSFLHTWLAPPHHIKSTYSTLQPAGRPMLPTPGGFTLPSSGQNLRQIDLCGSGAITTSPILTKAWPAPRKYTNLILTTWKPCSAELQLLAKSGTAWVVWL